MAMTEKPSRDGFSMVSTLAAMAVTALLGTAIMGYLGQMSKGAASSSASADLATRLQSLHQVMIHPEACGKAFINSSGTPVVFQSGATNPTTYSAAVAKIVLADSPLIEADHTYPGYKTANVTLRGTGNARSTETVDGVSYHAYLTELTIEATRAAGSIGSSSLNQKLALTLLTDTTTGEIKSCKNDTTPAGRMWSSALIPVSTVYAAGFVEIAHSLGQVPKMTNWVVVCVKSTGCNAVTRAGTVYKYEQDDEVDLDSTYSGGGGDFNARTTYKNATHLGMKWHAFGGAFKIGANRRKDSSVSADEIWLESPDWSLKAYAYADLNAAAVTTTPTQCPTGTSLVGNSSSSTALCITTTQQAAVDWYTASTTCRNRNQRLCTSEEWYSSCVATGTTPALTGMTGDWEYVADTGWDSSMAWGNAGCNDQNNVNFTGPYAFRCCVPLRESQ